MAARDGQIKLGVFLISSGYHAASWRHPRASLMDELSDWIAIAQMAEAAKLDMLFLADGLAANIEPLEVGSRNPHTAGSAFEPLTLLSALAAVTSRIGLTATVSSTYTEPYNLARYFASLDRLSGGRAGWNVVTTHQDGAAENFGGAERLAHDDRYVIAEEFVDVVRGLWDSWDDDAIVADRASGRFFHPDKVHFLNHAGDYYRVRGPLNVPRPPQGHPVLIQAGSSEPGRNLAARIAEVVFCAQPSLVQAKAFYDDIKRRAAGFGRSPDSVVIMPGFVPIVGRTRAEAEAKKAELRALIDPHVALHMMSVYFGANDFGAYPLDGPVPELPMTQGNQSRQALIYEQARRDNLTLRELAIVFTDSQSHWTVVGTPEEIADQMVEFYDGGGADGFNLLPAVLPDGLFDFVELVLPELRRRGRFRTEYEGSTLRDNLGLTRPGDRSQAARTAETVAS